MENEALTARGYLDIFDAIVAIETAEFLAIDSDADGVFVIYPEPKGCDVMFETIG